MKKLLSAFFVLAALTSCAEKKAPVHTVRIVIQPNEAKSDLDSFSKGLSERTGLQVETVISKDYADAVELFRSAKADFAFFSPLSFVQAERKAGAKVLLKKVYGSSEFYYSALIVDKKSSLKKVAELKGKKIAFVDPQSVSGYLYAQQFLKEAGLDPVKDVTGIFVGTHDAAVEAVLKGDVAAAAVWSDPPESGNRGAWTKVLERYAGRDIRVVRMSEPIPNDAFAVRSEFYEKEPDAVFKVMEALISMSEDGGNLLKKVFDTDKMATATSRHYDSVRNLEKALNL